MTMYPSSLYPVPHGTHIEIRVNIVPALEKTIWLMRNPIWLPCEDMIFCPRVVVLDLFIFILTLCCIVLAVYW